MGDCYLTDTSGTETRVEFTFGYVYDSDKKHLRVVLHHSSLPYMPTPPPSNPRLNRSVSITEEEVHAAQKMWGDGIVSIGAHHMNGSDYRAVASNLVYGVYA